MPHDKREALAARFPVHVTLRLCAGLPRLREKRAYRAVFEAFRAGCERPGFRLAHFAVLSNHMHLVVEAQSRERLARGMQGLHVRLARALNRVWKRRGKVFSDRYHDRILRSPREVRNVLGYVLRNAARHGRFGWQHQPDPYSSGPWFDGWRGVIGRFASDAVVPPIAKARTWLLNVGWRRHGHIPLDTTPGLRA